MFEFFFPPCLLQEEGEGEGFLGSVEVGAGFGGVMVQGKEYEGQESSSEMVGIWI